ncbi:MAG: leucine-rich repeat domain-containing protein [bacterium]|nr:leucine-rich repeat domain-containing protein [bacterium]
MTRRLPLLLIPLLLCLACNGDDDPIVVDTAPPGEVFAFTGSGGDTAILLTWSNPTDPDFDKVTIRRDAAQPPVTITEGALIYEGSGNYHDDDPLPSTTPFHYTAFTSDETGNISAGVSITVTTTTPDTTPPAEVTDFTATPGDLEIALTWTNPTDADFDHVTIRRADDTPPATPADGEEIYFGSDLQFVDTDMSTAVSLHYTIFTHDHTGNISAGTSLTASSLEYTVVEFPDEALESLIRIVLDHPTGEIRDTMCAEVAVIVGDGEGIEDLTGMEHFASLTTLRLPGNDLASDGIRPIADLSTLIELCLSGGHIRELGHLADLLNLEILEISSNEISDITKLESLENLSTLDLSDNIIDDLDIISKLDNLVNLNLAGNRIMVLNPLRDLTNLVLIDLSINHISEITALVDNPKIDDGDEIDLSGNRLSTTATTVHIPILQARGVRVTH